MSNELCADVTELHLMDFIGVCFCFVLGPVLTLRVLPPRNPFSGKLGPNEIALSLSLFLSLPLSLSDRGVNQCLAELVPPIDSRCDTWIQDLYATMRGTHVCSHWRSMASDYPTSPGGGLYFWGVTLSSMVMGHPLVPQNVTHPVSSGCCHFQFEQKFLTAL